MRAILPTARSVLRIYTGSFEHNWRKGDGIAPKLGMPLMQYRGKLPPYEKPTLRGDGEDRPKTSLQWKPKVLHQQTVCNDGEVPRLTSRVNPEVGGIPGDFFDICFTVMEDQRSSLVSNTDERPNVEPSTASISWHGRSIPTDRQSSLETWWVKFSRNCIRRWSLW